MNVERTARCIVPIAHYDDKKEALLNEQVYSYQYEIPTGTFTSRDGAVMSSEEMKHRLYKKLDPEPKGPAEEMSVDIESLLCTNHRTDFKKSTNRGRTDSVNINIRMCARQRYNGHISHQLQVETSHPLFIESLDSVADMYDVKRQERRGGVRYRKDSTDLQYLGEIALDMSRSIGDLKLIGDSHVHPDYNESDVITYMNCDSGRHQYAVIPASNVHKGMYVPVLTDNGEVVAEEVVDTTQVESSEVVYDLTVDKTHNFSSNRIGVHNPIYSWTGAEPEDQILAEEAETRVLEKTYRIPDEVWTACKSCIEQVDERLEKNIESTGSGGEFISLGAKDANAHVLQGASDRERRCDDPVPWQVPHPRVFEATERRRNPVQARIASLPDVVERSRQST
jgi:hypothetical protein